MNLSKSFTKREKILLILLALLMVFAAYYLAVFRPVSEALSEIRFQQEEAATQIALLEEKSVQLEQMRAELAEILSDPKAVEIPSFNNLQQLMAFLNTTLSPTRDYSLSFQPPELPTEVGGVIVRRSLTLSFSCDSYSAAREVVNKLHDGPYRCQVQGISIVPVIAPRLSPKKASSANIETFPVQLSVTVTYFELTDAVPPVDVPQ